MKIGLDASRAFINQRTGIEEYAYQVTKHLLDKLKDHEVIVYVRKGDKCTLNLPSNCKAKELPFARLWTQIGLSWEMLAEPVNVLFVPAHTTPWIHPEKSLVTIHGLEYEHCPQSYSWQSRLYHRFFIKKSCRWSERVIAVSQKTKKDLIDLYKIPAEKIQVIYNGYEQAELNQTTRDNSTLESSVPDRYLFYVGRIEKRKNIENIIKAFEILKEKYEYTGQLVLVGRPGYGYEQIKEQIGKSPQRFDIIEKGFITEKEKWKLFQQADVFLFPSLAEGFGIPILEAQSLGTPVVTTNYGPMDEVAGNQDILVDPHDPAVIAQLTNNLIKDKNFRTQVVERGKQNIQRFSWDQTARQIAQLILEKN